jgi:hypothetical protein
MKEVQEKQESTVKDQEIKKEIKEFMYQQKLLDIKEFKKDYLVKPRVIEEKEPQLQVTLLQQSQRRKDQLLSLYYAAQDFVTYDNLDFKIEMAMKHPKMHVSVQQKVAQMDSNSSISKRSGVLKQQLMNTIDDKLGQDQIEAKQVDYAEVKSMAINVLEKEIKSA